MAKTYIKWVGNKTRLIKHIILPDKIGDYYEPFLGSAALFFNVVEKHGFDIKEN